MPKIILEGHIVVPDNDLREVLAALPTHIELTSKEEGCLRFEVKQNPERPNVFSVYEEFIDRAAFDAHQRRVRTSAWGKIAERVERHYKITEAS